AREQVTVRGNGAARHGTYSAATGLSEGSAGSAANNTPASTSPRFSQLLASIPASELVYHAGLASLWAVFPCRSLAEKFASYERGTKAIPSCTPMPSCSSGSDASAAITGAGCP